MLSQGPEAISQVPAFLTSMGTSSPPPVVEGRASVRFSDLVIPWFGVVLRRWTNTFSTEWRHTRSELFWCEQFCVEFDPKRNSLELPKGRGRGDHLVYDSSPFGTARWALWEKTGVWVAWRAAGTYTWHSDRGEILPLGPSLQYPPENAWVCTDLAPEDTLGEAGHRRMWLTMTDFELASDRLDHVRVLQVLQGADSAHHFISGSDHLTSASSGDLYGWRD